MYRRYKKRTYSDFACDFSPLHPPASRNIHVEEATNFDFKPDDTLLVGTTRQCVETLTTPSPPTEEHLTLGFR